MRSPADPIRRLSRALAATWGLGAVAIAACAAWALRPPPAPAIGPSEPAPGAAAEPAPETGAGEALDRLAFEARLWGPPKQAAAAARAEAAPRPAPPARAFTLELIGIILDGEVRRAAIHGRGEDRIRILDVGEAIEGHTVTAVEADHVEVSDGRTTRRLRLREETP